MLFLKYIPVFIFCLLSSTGYCADAAAAGGVDTFADKYAQAVSLRNECLTGGKVVNIGKLINAQTFFMHCLCGKGDIPGKAMHNLGRLFYAIGDLPLAQFWFQASWDRLGLGATKKNLETVCAEMEGSEPSAETPPSVSLATSFEDLLTKAVFDANSQKYLQVALMRKSLSDDLKTIAGICYRDPLIASKALLAAAEHPLKGAVGQIFVSDLELEGGQKINATCVHLGGGHILANAHFLTAVLDIAGGALPAKKILSKTTISLEGRLYSVHSGLLKKGHDTELNPPLTSGAFDFRNDLLLLHCPEAAGAATIPVAKAASAEEFPMACTVLSYATPKVGDFSTSFAALPVLAMSEARLHREEGMYPRLFPGMEGCLTVDVATTNPAELAFADAHVPDLHLPAAYGSSTSGSPFINSKGEIVGILANSHVSVTTGEPPVYINTNFIVDLTRPEIRSFLAANLGSAPPADTIFAE